MEGPCKGGVGDVPSLPIICSNVFVVFLAYNCSCFVVFYWRNDASVENVMHQITPYYLFKTKQESFDNFVFALIENKKL